MSNKKLKIAVRKFDPFESALQKQWNTFCKNVDCEVELQAVPMELPELHQEILIQEGLKNGRWDIAQVSSDWVEEAYNTDSVECFNNFLSEKDRKNDFLDWPEALLQTQTKEQQILGIPFHDGPECLIYRKDLFEDSKNRKEYKHRYQKDLAPPETWEDFFNIATFFQRPERGLFGSVFAAYPDRHNAVFDFCLQVWTRGGALTDADGKINIASAAARQGLHFYRKLFCQSDCLHPDSSKMESVLAGEVFSRGEISMMINWFGFAAFCELSEETLVKGKIDVTDIPHGALGESKSLNSYWIYMIGKGSSEKQLAYEFIKFATNRKNDQLLTKEGGIGCRISTCNSEEINKIIPYFKKLKSLHLNAQTLPGVSYWPEIAAVIDDVMQKTIHTTNQINHILEEGQRLINQISENVGY